MANDIPIDRVKQMKAQNYSNSQIIDILQKDGFSSSQIFDAINQSDIGDGGSGLPPPPPSPALNDPLGVPPPPGPVPVPEVPKSIPDPLQDVKPAPVHVPHMTSAGNVSTEEYVEAIIEEKWAELENDVQKIVDWKNRSEQLITKLQQQFADLKDRFDKLHEALIGKIENYDKNILEVGAEIKAMEKVFSKVLPAFTDNVKQLNDITERMDRKI